MSLSYSPFDNDNAFREELLVGNDVKSPKE